MNHFSEQPWADFVRGVSGLEISRDIRTHLGRGCPQCKIAHNVWNQVRMFATNESSYAPPENLLRMVKLGFTHKAAEQPRNWTLANLVFDSFAQPLPVGIRSGTLNVWQVIYEAEGLSVDLRFGRRTQSKDVHLAGQVLDKVEARALQNNATVEVSTEQEQLVATTPVSSLGEFHMEFEAKEHLWLSVKAVGRNIVRIPLTNPR
ncbi:MAG: hypothetical protein WBW85_01985 [Terriglobales bacterium]